MADLILLLLSAILVIFIDVCAGPRPWFGWVRPHSLLPVFAACPSHALAAGLAVDVGCCVHAVGTGAVHCLGQLRSTARANPLFQVTITASDLVLQQLTPDAVYPGSVGYSLMYTASQTIYIMGVVSFVITNDRQPAPRFNNPVATDDGTDYALHTIGSSDETIP